MSDLIIRDRKGYARRRPMAEPYTRPGIWTDLRSMLVDLGLATLFWCGLIVALYWLWLR